MYNCIVISVDELWLKGKNRHVYFKAINKNVKEVVKKVFGQDYTCKKENQRLVLRTYSFFTKELIEALLKVPGINSIAPAVRTELDYLKISEATIELLMKEDYLPRTFKVKTKRSNKRFSKGSMEVSRDIGGVVLEKFPNLTVSVKAPELVIDIRILDYNAYISIEKLRGVGGFPVGVHGKLLTMLSGGFDSPVASYLMAKRGCYQSYIFFYAYPYVGDEVVEKIKKMTAALSKFQPSSILYIFPFGEIQDKIAELCHEEYRTVLFRRYMILASTLLSEKIGAKALVTGDSLGQVSSQTMDNLIMLDKVSSKSIFRPVIGYNKSEIIDLSRKIETHEISVIPHDDACSLFGPDHPILKAVPEYIDKVDSMYDWNTLLLNGLDKVESYTFDCNGKII